MVDYSKMSDDELMKIINQQSVPDYSKMSDDELMKIVNQQQPQNEVKPEFETSIGESISRAATDVLTVGHGDEIQGAIGGIKRGVNYLLDKTKGDSSFVDAIKTGYKSDRDAHRAAYDKSYLDNPGTHITTGIATGLATLPLMGKATLPKLMAQGAAYGLGSSNAELGSLQSGIDTAIGGGLGVASKYVGDVLGWAGNKVGSSASNILNKLKVNEALKSVGAQKSNTKLMDAIQKEGIANEIIGEGLARPTSTLSSQQSKLNDMLKKSNEALIKSKKEVTPLLRKDVLAQIKGSTGKDLRLLLNTPEKTAVKQTLKDIKTLNPIKPSDLHAFLESTGVKKTDAAFPKLLQFAKEAVENEKAIDMPSMFSYISEMWKKSRSGPNKGIVTDEALEQVRQDLQKMMYEAGLNQPTVATSAKHLKIGEFLQNKEAMASNNLFGPLGGSNVAMSVAAATGSGNPLPLLGILPGIPAIRSLIGKSTVTGIQGLQDVARNKQVLAVAEKLKIDPRVLVQILSQQISNSQKGEE